MSVNVYECEQKYLVDDICKKGAWEREQLVYQWYLDANGFTSLKEKLVFDFTRQKLIYARIEKHNVGFGKNVKQVEYLDIDSFSVENMLGKPFILKRRAIQEDVFLDRFIESNNICKYLLEIENSEGEIVSDEYKIVQRVTGDMRYYNENMCVPFTQYDAQKLAFLIDVFNF